MAEALPRVLVVDDEENVLIFLERALAALPCEVVTTNSSPEALKLLLSGPFTVVITDIRMPGVTGYTIGHAAKMQGKLKGVIFMTGHNILDIFPQAKSAGADIILQKPIRLDKIREVVQLYLGKA